MLQNQCLRVIQGTTARRCYNGADVLLCISHTSDAAAAIWYYCTCCTACAQMVETNAREYLGEGMLRMHQDAVTAFGLLENNNSSSNNNTGDASNTGATAAADAWNPSGTGLPTDGGSLLQEGDSPRPLHDRAYSVIEASAAGMPLNMALPGAAAEAAMQQQLAHEEVS
jgi:hypothetical protein